jgi:hypothetical protein
MSTLARVTQESIDLTRAAISGSDELIKAFSQPVGSATAGIQNYSLEGPAKILFPVLTPLRNRIPRRTATGGTQANWKAFTAINSTNIDLGISDGNRGGVVATTEVDYFAVFKQLGLEDYVTRAARLAAEGFMDILAQAQTNLLWATMIGEEALDLAGNTSLPLGKPTQPTGADSSTGGTIAAGTGVSCIVVPLTYAGFTAATIATGVRGAVTRTNADNSTDTFGGGTGIPSTARLITCASDASPVHSVLFSTPVIPGAAGYGWFWGPTGSEVLGALTTINSVVVTTAAGTGTQTAASLGASDNSTNALVYDGLLTQVAKTGYGGYYASMATGTAGVGTPLTADTLGGVVEIDTALQAFWDKYRLSPDTIWVNSQEQKNITHKVLQGSTAGAQRFMLNSVQGSVVGGDLVTTYLNKFGMNGSKSLNIRLHPNLPPGTILFDSETLPFPTSNVPEVLVKRVREDYRAEVWPQTTRKVPFSVTFDGVLQNYFPPAFGSITNIANG